MLSVLVLVFATLALDQSPNANYDEAKAGSYTLQRGTSTGVYDTETSPSSTSTSLITSVTGLSAGTTYYFRCRGQDTAGNTATGSEASQATSARTRRPTRNASNRMQMFCHVGSDSTPGAVAVGGGSSNWGQWRSMPRIVTDWHVVPPRLGEIGSYGEAVKQQSPASRSARWVLIGQARSTPQGLHSGNRRRAASVQPLRGRNRIANANPACAARYWARL